MSEPEFVNAQTRSASPATRARPQVALDESDFAAVAQHMFSLMLRNVASDGFPFSDPAAPGSFSKPGCVIAAPSYPANTPGVDQDYVFNWTRDAAITALELVAANVPSTRGSGAQPLIDYVTFAEICQDNATPTMGHACYTVGGESRPWSEQNDGPAIQSIAMLAAFDQLDAATRAIATTVIARTSSTCSLSSRSHHQLWEEHQGYSFSRGRPAACSPTLTSTITAYRCRRRRRAHGLGCTARLRTGRSYTCALGRLPVVASWPTVPPEQLFDPNIASCRRASTGRSPARTQAAPTRPASRQWATALSTVYRSTC